METRAHRGIFDARSARMRIFSLWREDYSGCHGVQHRATGSPMSIEKAQASRGFAHVEESGLEALLVSRGCGVPPEDAGGADRKVELTLACLKDLEPTWTHVDATRALNTCFLIEHPDACEHVPVDPDMLSEVVTSSEAKKVQELVLDHELLKAKRVVKQESTKARMPYYFKVAASSQKGKGKGKGKPPAALRWLPGPNPKTKDADLFVQKHCPESVHIFCDEYNGRWQVVSSEGAKKSVSWTKRGFGLAASETLDHAWSFHKDTTGADPPFSLEELRREQLRLAGLAAVC